MARGALYKTLQRLEEKGLLGWVMEEGTPERGGHPRRAFSVTTRGVDVLRESRLALTRLWDGLESVFEGKE